MRQDAMGRLIAVLALAAALASCAGTSRSAASEVSTPPLPAGVPKESYLPRAALPDSLAFNPAPPQPGSAAMAHDEDGARAGVALRGGPRFEQAAIDADIFSPAPAAMFSCAAGFAIGPETTPRLNALLRKSMMDFGLATYPTKTKYMRARPFMANGQPTCTPRDEVFLRKDGSYPSGHSAVGYGWSLILAEVVPGRAAELIARGRSFGESRRVCNVHWLSDIEEGRIVASAVFARLQADAAFRADVAAARTEVESLAASLPKPDCARESAALAIP